MNKEKTKFKIGDLVTFTIHDQELIVGRIIDITFKCAYPVVVKTSEGAIRFFTLDGRCHLDEPIVLFKISQDQVLPREVLVSNSNSHWEKKTLVCVDEGSDFPFVVRHDNSGQYMGYKLLKELPTEVELTMDDIAKKFGIPIQKLKIKK